MGIENIVNLLVKGAERGDSEESLRAGLGLLLEAEIAGRLEKMKDNPDAAAILEKAKAVLQADTPIDEKILKEFLEGIRAAVAEGMKPKAEPDPEKQHREAMLNAYPTMAAIEPVNDDVDRHGITETARLWGSGQRWQPADDADPMDLMYPSMSVKSFEAHKAKEGK